VTIPSHNINDLYKIMSVKCRISGKFTLFVVQLPLVTRTQFELYRLIPLPVVVNQSYIYISPSAELLMIDLQREIFYAMTSNKVSRCISIQPRKYLCPQTNPLYNRNAENIRCEAEMINTQKMSTACNLRRSNPSKIWIQLSIKNQWLFSLDQEYIFNVVCDNVAFQRSLAGTGLLIFYKRCVIKDEDTIIMSHSIYESTLNTTVGRLQPTINLTDELPKLHRIPEIQFDTSVTNHAKELSELRDKLEYIKGQESIPELSRHDIHQYSIGYSKFSITIVLCIGWIYCKWKSIGYTISSSDQEIPQQTHKEVPTPTPRTNNHPVTTSEPFKFEVRDFKVAEDV